MSRIVADRFERSALVAGDRFFGFLARGAIQPWLPQANEQNEIVTEVSALAAGRYASAGYMTVYDGIVGPWFLHTFILATGLTMVHYAVLLPTVDQCLTRVRTRAEHGFRDEDVTRQMHAQFALADIDRKHVFSSASNPPQELADVIVESVERGSLAFSAIKPP